MKITKDELNYRAWKIYAIEASEGIGNVMDWDELSLDQQNHYIQKFKDSLIEII